jgi:hypothetical protein
MIRKILYLIKFFFHLLDVKIEFLKVLGTDPVRILEVIQEINEEVRKDLISNKAIIVFRYVQVAEHYQTFFVMLIGQFFEASEQISTLLADRIAGVKVYYLDGFISPQEVLIRPADKFVTS